MSGLAVEAGLIEGGLAQLEEALTYQLWIVRPVRLNCWLILELGQLGGSEVYRNILVWATWTWEKLARPSR